MTYLGFVLCFIGSLGYLLTRKSKFDVFAMHPLAGLIFGLIVLTTGPLWARGAWERCGMGSKIDLYVATHADCRRQLGP